MNRKNAVFTVLVVVISAAGIICAWKHFTDYARILNGNWNFSLPSEARYTEVYGKDSGPSPHGDGIRYHIFSCRNNAPINEMAAWQSEEGKTRFGKCFSDTADEWLDRIDVPAEERPDYSECRYWYQIKNGNCEIIVFWDEGRSRLYVVESFI